MFYSDGNATINKNTMDNGMFVADAQDIDKRFVSVARKVLSDSDILRRCIPFPVLFCTPRSVHKQQRTLRNLARFVRAEIQPQRAQVEGLDFDEHYIHPGVPAKLEQFLHSITLEERLPKEWFIDSFRGVDGVFVIDLRRLE